VLIEVLFEEPGQFSSYLFSCFAAFLIFKSNLTGRRLRRRRFGSVASMLRATAALYESSLSISLALALSLSLCVL
jgi:hypothetical protein